MDNISNRIRSLRQEAGITRNELATASGVPVGALGHYERGDAAVSVAALEALANFFGCSTDYLLGRSDARQAIRSGSSDLLQKLQELLDQDAAAGRDCSLQYAGILQELLDLSAAATTARQALPEDPGNDDLTAYYNAVNQATSTAAGQIRLQVSLELFPALIKTK